MLPLERNSGSGYLRAIAWGTLLALVLVVALTGCAQPVAQSNVTPPPLAAIQEDPVRIALLGDTQPHGEPNRVVAGELLSTVQDPDLVCITGDLVNAEDDAGEWDMFWESLKPVAKDVPLYAVPGNHTPTTMLDAEQRIKGFAILDYEPVRVLMLDTNRMVDEDPENVEQISGFFEEALSGADDRFVIAVMHFPPYPVIDNKNDVKRGRIMLKHYGEYFEDIHLAFCGHEHHYSRSKVGELIQVVGNASPKRYNNRLQNPYVQKYLDIQTATQIDVNDTAMIVTTRDSAGEVVDEFTIMK